ncbi:MAG: hypothetical protein FWG42_11930 [Clostridiales bacterium]|nr:hypothetical protein [Clostridiales bacterium]
MSEPEPVPDTQPIASYTEAELELTLEAGNLFVSELKNRIQPSNEGRFHYYDMEYDAVAAFERFFLLDTLHVSGMYVDPNAEGNYICSISGSNQFGETLSVDVVFSYNDSMSWFCPLVEYCELSSNALEAYLGYLRTNDLDGLARWLAADREASRESSELARMMATYCNRHFDLSETEVSECRLIENGFVYSLKDSNGEAFQVEMRYSDGLCLPTVIY